MCVILVKEKGIELPTKKVLKCCWERNPDGAGFMFNDYGKVIIMKGFMTFEEFYLRLQTANEFYHLKEKGLVIIKLGKWFHNGNYYFSNLNHVSKNTLNINKKPILFDNDLKYFDEENNNFVINDEVVDKDYFDLFIDTLDRLENGDSVYSDDYFQEYNSFNGKYYLNKDEKKIYELIGNNELMFVDYYKSKEEYYKLKL